MGLLTRLFNKDMYSDATFLGKDTGGNYIYMPKWFKDFFACGKEYYKNEFDLTTTTGKYDALRYCYPFASVIDRCGKMMMNGKIYVVDKQGNEKPGFNDVRALLEEPNPMQSGKAFMYEVESSLRAYGFCAIYLNRVGENSPVSAMCVIPAHLFHITSTGKRFNQVSKDGIIESAYIELGQAQQMQLQPYEYCLIYNSIATFPYNRGDEIRFNSSIDSLSLFAKNYMSAVIARSNLIVNGGPKGILYGNDTSETGNASLTPKEADELNRAFKKKYGLVNKLYEIMVTNKKVGWIPLGSNVEQLKLHEEADRCQKDICNAIGAQPDLFSQGATFDNKEAAKRATYQDLIIPDSLNIAQVLTSVLCPVGCYIQIDFSDISCLATDKAKIADALGKAASAISSLLQNNLITIEEARYELAKYIDIDPTSDLNALQGDENDGELQTPQSVVCCRTTLLQ